MIFQEFLFSGDPCLFSDATFLEGAAGGSHRRGVPIPRGLHSKKKIRMIRSLGNPFMVQPESLDESLEVAEALEGREVHLGVRIRLK